jgi:hypothetical protein
MSLPRKRAGLPEYCRNTPAMPTVVSRSVVPQVACGTLHYEIRPEVSKKETEKSRPNPLTPVVKDFQFFPPNLPFLAVFGRYLRAFGSVLVQS